MTDLSLLQDFVTETVEHLEEMEGNLLQLVSDPGNGEILNDIFRSVHTIKGAAEYLGMERIAELSHKLENLLDLLRHNECKASVEVIDLLMAARDRISILTADLHHTQFEQTDIGDLLEQIQSLVAQKPSQSEKLAQSAPAERPAAEVETVAESPGKVIYAEEQDEELFGIFLEQLQEGLDALQSLTDTLPVADPTDRIQILKRCRGQIDPLRSSANYMGYGKLTALYDQWDAALQSAGERLENGEDHFLSGFIADPMQANLNAIGETFPKLNLPAPAPSSPMAEPGDSACEETDALSEDHAAETADRTPSSFNLADDSRISPDEKTDDTLAEAFDLFREEDSADDAPGLSNKRKSTLDMGLLQDFITETVEHLGEMETNLLQLESDRENQDILNNIFRSVHTIKGAAEYLGMERIAELSHKLENLLDSIRQHARAVNREVIDLLITARDRIGILIADLHQTQTEQTDIEDLLARIQSLASDIFSIANAETAEMPAGQGPATAEYFPDVPTNAQEMEIYEEEHDEELFGIFLEQLQEGLDAFQALTNALTSAALSDRIKILERCLGQIDPLRSSANYMGYRKLTALYDRWHEAIRTARERLEEQDENCMPAFIAGCMQATIDDISRCFPRLERSTAEPAPQSRNELDDSPKATLGQERENSLTESVRPNDSLFDRLSQSFDCRMAENQAAGDASPPSGMELELFSEEPAAGGTTPDANVTGATASFAVDPLTAYVEASDTPGPEKLTADLPPIQEPFAATESPAVLPPAIDHDDEGEVLPDMADGTPNDDFSYVAPDEPPQFNFFPENLSPPATDVSVKTPATALDNADEERRPDATIPSAPTTETAPALASPAIETAPVDSDQPSGDRRDPDRPGRRKADRVGEQLLRQSIRVDAAKIDNLMNQVGELVVSRAWFSQLFHEMRDLQQNLQHRASLDPREMKQVKGLTFRLSEATVALGRVANELQEGVMKVRMLPIAQLFNRYPRLVFDLVRDGNKKVKLDIKGEETELDKMVIEAISDPMIHIIRNAVDHGIEPLAERQRIGKPESGTIHLEAYHEGNHVVIEIADDGRGLDIDRIKSKAIAGNFASREEIDRMPLKELTSLIMQPGFSTATEITHTSGRGVGMDVVKQNIEKLNGTIEIDSTPGIETRFRIKIPLTLAIIPALLVQVRGELFTIPLSTVEETIRIAPQDLSTIEGVEVMQLRESTLPLVRLADLFNMPAAVSADGRAFVVVVSTGMKRVGLVVNALLGQEEVVIKPLEDYLQEESGFSGATILGDGRISLILDIYELVNLSIDRQAHRKKVVAPA